MATRKRLKKQVYFVFAGLILIIALAIFGLNKYKEYQYHQTYEYKLLEHGYDEEEVTTILDNFSDNEHLDYFLNNEKNSNIVKLLDAEYYLDKHFYDYGAYLEENQDLSTSSIIRNINVHLDKDFYEVEYETDTSLDTQMLVNKYYLLSSDYAPDDLVSVPQTYSWGELGSQKVREVAYNAFLDMWHAAEQEGYYLMINSSYRSYQDQEAVYNNYKSSSGQKYADSIAARPGSSEHQTGLAIDIFSKTNTNRNSFTDSPEAKWLEDNAHKYGFILRYPEDKVDITGYNYESWHFRYVGEDIATYIYEHDITFEEYYAYFIEK